MESEVRGVSQGLFSVLFWAFLIVVFCIPSTCHRHITKEEEQINRNGNGCAQLICLVMFCIASYHYWASLAVNR